MDTRERLVSLMEMAREPGDRRALAFELASLLPECPPDMREAVALVLEKSLPRLDGETRFQLAVRLSGNASTPLGLLNEIFFDAGAEARKNILARIARDLPCAESCPKVVDEAALIAAVRKYPRGTFVHVLARMFGIPAATAARVVVEPGGEGLAILCKGASLSRATHSTLALLTDAAPNQAQQRLDLFESVANDMAVQLVALWRYLAAPRSATAGQAA